MNKPASVALAGLLLYGPAVMAELEEEGELKAKVPITATLTLSTCDLVLTDRSGTPMPAVVLEQIESGLVTTPPAQADFALTPRSSQPHCLANLPDVTIAADYSSIGTGNIVTAAARAM